MTTPVPPPPSGWLIAIRSTRRKARGRETVTRLFRQIPAAERHAAYEQSLGHEPIEIFEAWVGDWQHITLEEQ